MFVIFGKLDSLKFLLEVSGAHPLSWPIRSLSLEAKSAGRLMDKSPFAALVRDPLGR